MECTRTSADAVAEAAEHAAARRDALALAAYERAVALDPSCGDAWRGLAILAYRGGDRDAARGCIARALRADAGDAAAHRIGAAIDEADGRYAQAYRGYVEACRIEPDQPLTTIALARVALRLGYVAEAAAIAGGAVAKGSRDADAWRTLGTARALQRDYPGAADALEASLRIEPQAGTYAALAGVRLRLDAADAALAAARCALDREPEHPIATLHLGVALYAQGALDAAVGAFERAIALGCDEAHTNLGRVLLLLGDYRNGWRHFGWNDARRRALAVFGALPMWDGTPDPRMRLLVWHEQGVGDTIQMARFLGAARERAGSLTLACPPATHDLLRGVAGVDAVCGMQRVPFAAFDRWLPAMRLPVIFDAEPPALPAPPYLRADPVRVERFARRLEAPGLRVGLVWSGNPKYARDATRSCPLAALAPLGDIAGITWFALQQGAARAETPPPGLRLEPVNAAAADFADTAAIVAGLDLVITVDTSVAHLAGALAKPAWVMLPERCDWRWQLAGDDSAWYPSLRLIRTPPGRGWDAVVAELAAGLRRLTR